MIDNEKTRKTPVLRFKGFTDDWEQRKLGELGKARSGMGFPDAEQGGKEGVPFYKVSDMNNVGNEHEMVAANNYVTREQIARKGWKPIDEVPAIFFAKVGAAVLLNRKRLCRFPFLLDNNTMAYSIDGSALDADFAITLFDTIDLTSLVQVGALPSYNSGDVENIDVVIPEMSEQRKIGDYFKRIDSLITLHQKKVFSLTIVKKSMLEKMFPKAGSKVPEIRFYGFTGDWEQRKLGEITEISSGQNVPNEDGGKYYNLTMGSVNTEGHLVCSLHTNRSDRLLVKGTLIMPTRDVGAGYVIGRTAVIDENDKYYAGNCLYCLSTGLNEPYYIHHYMNSEMARKSMQIIVAGGSQKQITLPGIKSIEVPICSIEEQRKIAQLFNDLDKTITLHQKELDKLLALKKSMLSEMFPK